MQNEKSLAAFNSFGRDLKAARESLGISRRQMHNLIGIDPSYLANIENSGFIPSLSYFYDLVTICKLPVEKYFFPERDEQESKARERVKLKLALCPEKYLQIVEATINGILMLEEAEDA